ncbi:restriction endonuclease [Benzoatithermus flavus]|uniref:Restriction endonuclease n=1 Tax=Benzoatithermus flavus TaxID=3108223 RepID=A0ABU8XR16_9PROT
MIEAAAAVAAVLVVLTLWGILRERSLSRTRHRFDALVGEHLPVLVRKRRQLVRVDDYGVVDRSRWEKEIRYFFDKVIFQSLPPADVERIQERLADFTARLEAAVEARQADAAAEMRFDRVKTGAEFELFCADELKRAGWQVMLTGASRDQGADLIAERGGDRLVVQCKLLSRPVGNYAVQEVVAARSHHLCNRAAVVSNQRFTASAIELAATNNVELWHWSELARL